MGALQNTPSIFTMVAVAQLVRAPDCGSGGRGFETHQPPIWLGEINGHCLFPNFACILNASKNIILKRNYPILLLLLSLLKSEAKEKFKYLSRKKTQTPIFKDPSTK